MIHLTVIEDPMVMNLVIESLVVGVRVMKGRKTSSWWCSYPQRPFGHGPGDECDRLKPRGSDSKKDIGHRRSAENSWFKLEGMGRKRGRPLHCTVPIRL